MAWGAGGGVNAATTAARSHSFAVTSGLTLASLWEALYAQLTAC